MSNEKYESPDIQVTGMEPNESLMNSVPIPSWTFIDDPNGQSIKPPIFKGQLN